MPGARAARHHPTQGWHGDLNETFVVGEVDEASKQLVKATHDVRQCGRRVGGCCAPKQRAAHMHDN